MDMRRIVTGTADYVGGFRYGIELVNDSSLYITEEVDLGDGDWMLIMEDEEHGDGDELLEYLEGAENFDRRRILEQLSPALRREMEERLAE